MLGYSSVTQKGQVTIPIDMRNFLGVKKGDEVAFVISHKKILITKVEDYFELKGSVDPKGKVGDAKKLRENFIDYLGKRKTK